MDSTVDKLTERFEALSPSVKSPAVNAGISEAIHNQAGNFDVDSWKLRLRKRQVTAQSVVVDEKPKSKKSRNIVIRREAKTKRKAIYIPSKRLSQKRIKIGNNLEKVKSLLGANDKNSLPDSKAKQAPRLVPNFNIAFDDDEDEDCLDFVASLTSDEELDGENIRIEAGKRTGNQVKSSTPGAGSGSRNSYPYFSLPSLYTSPTPSPDRLVMRKFIRKPVNTAPKKSGKRGMYKRLWKVKEEGGDSISDGSK